MAIDTNQHSILLATLGTEPQVVTATVDLLRQRGERVTCVQVLHTVSEDERIHVSGCTLRKAFLAPDLFGHVSLEMIPIRDPNAQPLRDIQTSADIQAAFRSIYRAVYKNKMEGCKLHFQMAGGRKPLGLFAMVTAQLLFEDTDHLWYLISEGEFLSSKRLHPLPEDTVSLLEIPVIPGSSLNPALFSPLESDDPYQVLSYQQELRIKERLEKARTFVDESLTQAEERAVSLLVREGFGDQEIAALLTVSPRTIEQQLRSAYAKAADFWDLEGVNRAQLISLLNLYYSVTPQKNTGNSA